jgi:phosphosulfolactate phosphohydrolase-like enzyme
MRKTMGNVERAAERAGVTLRYFRALRAALADNSPASAEEPARAS